MKSFKNSYLKYLFAPLLTLLLLLIVTISREPFVVNAGTAEAE